MLSTHKPASFPDGDSSKALSNSGDLRAELPPDSPGLCACSHLHSNKTCICRLDTCKTNQSSCQRELFTGPRNESDKSCCRLLTRSFALCFFFQHTGTRKVRQLTQSLSISKHVFSPRPKESDSEDCLWKLFAIESTTWPIRNNESTHSTSRLHPSRKPRDLNITGGKAACYYNTTPVHKLWQHTNTKFH